MKHWRPTTVEDHSDGTSTVTTHQDATDILNSNKELLNDYDVNQFVVHSEADMHDRIDYYFDEYQDYLEKKAIKDKHAENTLKQQGWELD